jgi:hypothetical protein
VNVIILLIGVIAGANIVVAFSYLFSRILKKNTKVGRFMINNDDPMRPAFWLELDYDLDVLEKQRSITFQIKLHTQSPS